MVEGVGSGNGEAKKATKGTQRVAMKKMEVSDTSCRNSSNNKSCDEEVKTSPSSAEEDVGIRSSSATTAAAATTMSSFLLKQKILTTVVVNYVDAKYSDSRPSVPSSVYYVEPSLFDCAHRIYTSNANSIFLGPKQAAGRDAYQSLLDANVGGIVNCTTRIPCYHRNNLHQHNRNDNDNEKRIRYCQVPIHDIESADMFSYLDGVTTFMHTILSRLNQSVLVHCEFGVSRSSTIVIAYLMRYQGMTRDQAYVKTKSMRPCTSPNVGFWNQLKQWEDKLLLPSTTDNNDKTPPQEEDEDAEPSEKLLFQFDKAWAMECNISYSTCRELPGYILKEQPCWKVLLNKTRRHRRRNSGNSSGCCGVDDNDQNDEEATTTIIMQMLQLCLDYIWGRGVLKVDLEWLAYICRLVDDGGGGDDNGGIEDKERDEEGRNNKNYKQKQLLVDTVISITQDPESDFCTMWAGEIYPEQIDLVIRTLSTFNNACSS